MVKFKVDELAIAAAINWHKEKPLVNTIRQAAIRFGVKRSTLQDRINGRKSRLEVSQENLLLYLSKEEELVKAILAHCDCGFPVRIPQLPSWALQILHRCLPYAWRLGRCWANHFLRRHSQLYTRWHQNMDRVRIAAASQESLTAFYDLVSRRVTKPFILLNRAL